MGVEKIEPSNYRHGLKRIRQMTCVVLVFHPQCGHCIQMRSNWEAMKSMTNPRVKIVELNGEGIGRSSEFANSPVGRATKGFPSILRMDRGRLVERYEGERTPEKMAEFVNKAVEPMKRKATKSRSKKMRGKTKKLRRKN